LGQIREELEEQLQKLSPLEAHRLKQRTKYDLEMMEELGFCSGIENYSRHFDGRNIGEPPFVLIDYFPKDYLLIIDESHQSIPQSRAMFNGIMRGKRILLTSVFDYHVLMTIDRLGLKSLRKRWEKRYLFQQHLQSMS